MKQHYKTIDGKMVFYKDPLIMGDVQIFNPSEEQLVSGGWAEYTEPVPTDAELLQEAKNSKLMELDSYDSSDAVNSFIVGSAELWVPADKRAILRISIEAYKALGQTSITKVWEGKEYTFLTDTWLYMLNSVEVYASECFNTTERHRAAIRQLSSINEVEAYDYTTGYPEKLIF